MIRKAQISDLENIEIIYEIAKKYMRANGNMNQWINGYPSRELLANDIESGNLYVVENDDNLLAVFAFIIGEDPTYSYIEGKWLTTDSLYGTIHRIASNGKVSGILAMVVEYCFKQVAILRIDTHADNKKMQETIDRCGFKKCGIIYLQDGSPRIAFEKIKQ